MTDAQFYKSFSFNLFHHRRCHMTDQMTSQGCPYHYIARMIHGTAKISTSTTTLFLKEGDIFYIPRGLKYRSYWYPDGETVQFYSFGFDYFPSDEHTFYKLQKLECNAAEKALLSELESDLTATPLSIGRLYRFLGEIYSKMLVESTSANQVIVNKAMEFMRQNSGYTVSDVARHCGISESGLFVKFRQHLNQTPVEARHRILTDKAAELLCTTDLAIDEISDQLGFSSSSYFRKVFRAQTGQTPSEYRKRSNVI